jgi:hypothetical protein
MTQDSQPATVVGIYDGADRVRMNRIRCALRDELINIGYPRPRPRRARSFMP